MWREPTEGIEPALKRYTARMLEIFEAPQQAANAQGNELTPRVLDLSPEARKIWIAFHDETEGGMGETARFVELCDVAGKAAEQAARVAGVLTMIDDPHSCVISAGVMARGCRLMRWYLSEALRLTDEHHVPQEMTDAQTILKWIRVRGLRQVDAAAIQKSGPGPLRRKERLYPAIEALVEAGWLKLDETATGKARRWCVVREQ